MKTLAERTGLRFTKRRPRKLPDPPYVLAHCRAGWFVISDGREFAIDGPVKPWWEPRTIQHLEAETFTFFIKGESFRLTQDDEHYDDEIIVFTAYKDATIERWYADGTQDEKDL